MKQLPFTKSIPLSYGVTKPIYHNGAQRLNIFSIHSNGSCNSTHSKIRRSRLSTCSPLLRSQAGDFLIEAIIGLVLMAIVAVGVTTVTAKVEKGKRDMSVQELAVSQLRELLIRHGNGTVNLCDSTVETISLPTETTPLTVTATGCNPIAGTVNGVTFTDLKQPIVLSVGSDSGPYGKITVGGAIAAQ
jgi:hypothetical protein